MESAKKQRVDKATDYPGCLPSLEGVSGPRCAKNDTSMVQLLHRLPKKHICAMSRLVAALTVNYQTRFDEVLVIPDGYTSACKR